MSEPEVPTRGPVHYATMSPLIYVFNPGRTGGRGQSFRDALEKGFANGFQIELAGPPRWEETRLAPVTYCEK